jgi:protein tyrosine phosphatase
MKRRVCLLQYTHWPDQGTPSSTDEISKLLDKKEKLSQLGGPTIVHCSAGIGRTGTFIAAELLIKRMKMLISELQLLKEEDFEPEGEAENCHSLSATPLKLLKLIVRKLREQRCGMVQTEEQYKFIYQIFKDKLLTDWSKVFQLHKLKEDVSHPFSDRLKVSYALLHSNEIEYFVGPEPVGISSCSTINVQS